MVRGDRQAREVRHAVGSDGPQAGILPSLGRRGELPSAHPEGCEHWELLIDPLDQDECQHLRVVAGLLGEGVVEARGSDEECVVEAWQRHDEHDHQVHRLSDLTDDERKEATDDPDDIARHQEVHRRDGERRLGDGLRAPLEGELAEQADEAEDGDVPGTAHTEEGCEVVGAHPCIGDLVREAVREQVDDAEHKHRGVDQPDGEHRRAMVAPHLEAADEEQHGQHEAELNERRGDRDHPVHGRPNQPEDNESEDDGQALIGLSSRSTEVHQHQAGEDVEGVGQRGARDDQAQIDDPPPQP